MGEGGGEWGAGRGAYNERQLAPRGVHHAGRPPSVCVERASCSSTRRRRQSSASLARSYRHRRTTATGSNAHLNCRLLLSPPFAACVSLVLFPHGAPPLIPTSPYAHTNLFSPRRLLTPLTLGQSALSPSSFDNKPMTIESRTIIVRPHCCGGGPWWLLLS